MPTSFRRTALFLCLLFAGIYASSDADARPRYRADRAFNSQVDQFCGDRYCGLGGGGEVRPVRGLYRAGRTVGRKAVKVTKRAATIAVASADASVDASIDVAAGSANILAGYANHLVTKGGRFSLAGYPQPLISKVREIESACPGSKVISAYRPGARVRGSGARSLHAVKRAIDMAGNPSCMYARLRNFPGGVSVDYGRMRHVHFSYMPGGQEWGARFRHYAGRKAKRHRYARVQ